MQQYQMEPGIVQTIQMKLNQGLAFPDPIVIRKAELYHFHPQPREKVWKDGTGRISRSWCFPTWLRLYDTEGFCGEGPVLPEVWNIFLPMMLEDAVPRTNLEWRQLFYWRVRGDHSTFRALETLEYVLFDLLAKRRNMPAHRMLGARKDWTDCYRGGGTVLQSDEELVEELLEIKEAGYRATKFKISLNDWERDVRRMEKVRKALGPEMKIAVDSNQAWPKETCMQFLREAAPYDIAWYEEPTDAFDMDEIAALTAAIRDEGLNVPVAYGESARRFHTFKAYIDAGVQVIQPLPQFYTLAEQLRTMEYARSRGCRITSGQNDLPGVLIGALLQPGEPIEFHRPNTERIEDYFNVRATLHDGRLYLPDCPGLPVRVDLERLQADGLLREKQTLDQKSI